MQRVFPLVIRKSGEQFITGFPVELSAGDQLLVVREMQGSKIPDGEKWTIDGYGRAGPTVSKIESI